MNANLSAGRADSTKAATNAHAPGMSVYGSPASRKILQTMFPGSETTGVPASETTATVFPSRENDKIFSAASVSLNL